MRHRQTFMALTSGCVAVTLFASAGGANNDETAPQAQRWTPAAVSSSGYESSPTFTPDGKTMIFIGADEKFLNFQLKQSTCQSGEWSAPVPVSFAAKLPVIEADPFVTEDGKRLYFISSRHAPEREDFDIWYVDRLPSGQWGEPIRLPEPVNSPGAELLPRMTADGSLYFGSDRPGGLGMGDIYVAREGQPGKWDVRNLGPPINTVGHEVEAEISRDGKSMIVVADRPRPSHLYRYELNDGQWSHRGRVPALDAVFQVGPLLSPKGDRLLFAQRDGARSGEMFLVDLEQDADRTWPPDCRDQAR